MPMSEPEQGEINIPELNDLRIKLDQMTGRITSRLKDRSRFTFNGEIYVPDGVPIVGHEGTSLVEFAIDGLESYHASLGRYDDSDQYPVFGHNLPTPSVVSAPQESVSDGGVILSENLNSSNDLIPFYTDLVKKHTEPGDDPKHYGETAYVDADLIQMIHERINVGRHVADIKGRQDQTIFECESDEEIESKLRDKVREGLLLDKVSRIAEQYELDPEFALDAFRWIIERTVQLEVDYIHVQNGHQPDNLTA